MSDFDIIALSEVKTTLPVCLPGYVSYRSKPVGTSDRGGVVVLIRNSLSVYVHGIDASTVDQLWLRLSCIEGIMFGFCYVPPCESQYYSHDAFATIQEKIMSNHMRNGYIIMGDLNARFGRGVRELAQLYELPDVTISYPIIEDDIARMNDNAELMATICLENRLIVLNNLKTGDRHFLGGKTYRKRDTWVSELDTCILSPELIKRVDDFVVIKETDMPSDHAPISIIVQCPGVCLDNILARASMLGDHAVLYGSAAQVNVARKPIKFGNIMKEKFAESILCISTPEFHECNDVNTFAKSVSDALYKCAESSRCAAGASVQQASATVHLGRWESLLRDADDARVWKAISWKGNFGADKNDKDKCPSDEEFKIHFERVLNPPPIPPPLNVSTDVTIPVLDDPISPAEVEYQMRKLKVDKACGPDGLSPGVLTMLPAQWVLTLTSLFNAVFESGVYPESWRRAIVFTVFKRGDKTNVDNYRGISVINSISKLYDMIMCCRLNQWFRPYREQAGAQSKRGCTEHIVSLRLLTDMAHRQRLKLYVTFVDFSKAYDKVPREKLFTILKRLGCGVRMLASLVAMYRVTESVIGGAVMTASLGVRQGSPTSCLLFVIFMNELIKMLKESCAPDGFLGWLHALVLMDDTVLLSTSREGMIRKIRILKNFCNEYGMTMNQGKTKFFVISGTKDDMEPLHVDGMVISSCTHYVYLGSPFTSDGSVTSALRVHAKSKTGHVLKFVSFVKKNNDVPFIVKRRVFDAALTSALLYGCESWVGGNMKPVIKLYNWAMKQLLGVRKSTPNDVCYAEIGYPSLTDSVKQRQQKFYSKVAAERVDLVDDPLMFCINIVTRANISVSRIISEFESSSVPKVSDMMSAVHERISVSNGSRCVVYQSINPEFAVHNVYKDRHAINDRYRMAFTRLRVSGHSLCIETGRWNRRGRGRLPREERLCVCGDIQTEKHVVEDCPVSSNVRNSIGLSNINDLFNEKFSHEDSCKIIYDILNLYD